MDSVAVGNRVPPPLTPIVGREPFEGPHEIAIPMGLEPITSLCDALKNRITHIYGCSTAVIAIGALVSIFVFAFFKQDNTSLAVALALAYVSIGATLLARNNVQLKSLADEIGSFKRDEERLKRDNARLELDVHELSTKNEEFEKELQRLLGVEKDLSSLVGQYRKENNDLKANVDRLEGATVHIETTALHVLQIQDLEQQLHRESEKAFEDRKFRQFVETNYPDVLKRFNKPVS